MHGQNHIKFKCSVAYYIVILSEKLLCFWLHVYVNTHIIIYIVLLQVSSIDLLDPYIMLEFLSM